MRKIVVTGALGHIGSRLIRELPRIDPGARILMIDNLSTQRYCSLFNLPETGRYVFVEADVLEADLRKLFQGGELIVHLAAITDAADSSRNRDAIQRVNYGSTKRVAGVCAELDIPLIFASSTSVYGSQQDLVDEECPREDLKPQSPYAEIKLREEELLDRLGVVGGLRFMIFRFGTICGVSPGMRFHTAVNKFCWQAVMGQGLTVWRTALDQKRPYLTLEDAIGAIGFVLRERLYDRQVYNVVTENLTVRSVIDVIRKKIWPVEIQYIDSEIMNQLSYEVSSVRLRRKGFEFRGSIERCIEETIELLLAAGERGVGKV